jgi:hypothetical protein
MRTLLIIIPVSKHENVFSEFGSSSAAKKIIPIEMRQENK